MSDTNGIVAILITAIAALIIILVIVRTGDQAPNASVPTIAGEISVPDGYTFADASAWGGYQEFLTIYCQKNGTNRVFDCSDGQIGREILIPDGYEFAGVSEWGLYSSFTTYYCRQISTGRVFVCN